MQFAVQGITFQVWPEGSFGHGAMVATDQNGLTCVVDILDYCYDASDKSAIIAAREFIAEINGRDAR